MARPAFVKFSPAASLASQRAAVMRWPVKPTDSSESSQRIGGPMISGRSTLSRGQPEAVLGGEDRLEVHDAEFLERQRLNLLDQ